MNTLTRSNDFIKQNRARDYVIALDGLEFTFRKAQLDKIKELHNEGYSYKDISKKVLRHEYEVIIALLHLVKEGHYLRPFGGVA